MPRKQAKKTAKKTSDAKKSDIKDMSQAHGKDEKFQPTTLDQIWGDDGLGRYGTMEETEYKGQLDEMTKTDIRAHAMKLGLVPVDNRDLLVKTLLKEFNKHVSQFKKPVDKESKSNDMSDEVRKILGEGR